MSDKKNYKILQKECLFQGFFRIDRYHLRKELYAGGWSEPFSRELFNGSGEAAIVLLFDPRKDAVIMIEQFRPGPLVHNEDPNMLELVAGMIGPSETIEETAIRESMEEATCNVTELQKIYSYYPSPGGVSERVTIFAGRTEAPEDGTICGLESEQEDIRVRVFDASQAISFLSSGLLRDAPTIIAMQWFSLHHTELRSRWLAREASAAII